MLMLEIKFIRDFINNSTLENVIYKIKHIHDDNK